ncbi:MAG: phosphate acyltransferase PlsX [Gammaproteobacteria bacterium]|nr:MAG: phosphate acyltransferase PlsX [Gammaproteobacteria bacterium]
MSQANVVIALDAMGGDHGPDVVLPAAAHALARHPRLHLVLVGDEARLAGRLPDRLSAAREAGRVRLVHAPEVVGMDEAPSHALRFKKQSSMRRAIDLVKAGEAAACVSAGNTGALMATARYVLKTLPGIDRPAIATFIPTMRGHTLMLDLGANIDSTAEHLFQFAVMGSVLVQAIDANRAPRVGLLNIGEEEIKGNDQVKEAARLLSDTSLNYIGFVEGDDIYQGTADVVVCDGFVGNVALKTSEGVAKMIAHFLREEFQRNPFTRLAGLVALPVIRALRRRVDPRRYNGASLLGLRGIVIKSHGGADALAYAHAIEEALQEVDNDVPNLIDHRLETLLTERQAV